MDKNIDDLFRLAQVYRPQQVGIEVTGQQAGFIQWIQGEMFPSTVTSTSRWPVKATTASPGFVPTPTSWYAFNTMVPLFKARKIFFPVEKKNSEPLAEAMNELELATPGGFKSKHDDFIDTISMLASLTPWETF